MVNRTILLTLLSAALLSPKLESFAAPDSRSLRETAAGLFEMGVGISDRIPERTNDWPLLTTQFGTLTPENCMKPVALQPVESQFNFAQADAFVAFAARHRLKVVGH